MPERPVATVAQVPARYVALITVTAFSGLRWGEPAGFHFDDLRHTGNNIAAASGASTREQMHRMGRADLSARDE